MFRTLLLSSIQNQTLEEFVTETKSAELARVAELCEKHNIQTVECIVVDNWGIPRGKRLPTVQFLRDMGFGIANVVHTWQPRCEIEVTPVQEIWDIHCQPDLASFRVAGWGEGIGVVFCDTYDTKTHELVDLDPRIMLKNVLAKYDALGYNINAATELEFYLFNPDGTPLFSDMQTYGIAKGAELEPIINEIRETLRLTGIDVEASNVEYGPSQIEINVRYGEALKTADETILFKYIVHMVAKNHGLVASFMAKPIVGESGCGMHVHQSIVDKNGKNSFVAQDSDGALGNALMKSYVAGLMAHAKALQVVMAPTINAYKRIVDYSFSPTQVTWGLDNRLVGVRCLLGGEGTRIESRWAAADANPYLVLAGSLFAGLDGITNDLPLIDMVEGDPHPEDKWDRLASTLGEAVANFEGSEFTKRAFGENFVSTFSAMQRVELAAYSNFVTDWELNRYRDII